jgi:anti-anti-sigma factor
VAGSPEFRIDQATDGATVGIKVVGDVDAVTVRAFGNALDGALRTTTDRVTVDLEQVTYLGSDGVRALIDAAGVAAETNRRLEVTAASPIARRVLHVVGLQHLLRS